MKLTISAPKRIRQWHKILIVLVIVGIIGVVGASLSINYWYSQNLKPVQVGVVDEKVLTIESGANVKIIAAQLKEANLIRNSRAFEWFVTRAGLRASLQAGTYKFSPSQSVERIVTMLKNGEVDSSFITVLPGKRLAELKAAFLQSGYAQAEIDSALAADQYRSHPSLADLPSGATLEGYLYPETLKITSVSGLKSVIDLSLTELDKQVTPELLAKLESKNLNLHQAFTLASIVEKETSTLSDRPIVAQVFLKRLQLDMMLGSDVTFIYAAKERGVTPTVNLDSAYNTRINKGLPPGPISNFSSSSLKAVANPADTDYLYFVAGDDGKTYYGNNEAEHNDNIQKYCTKLCQ